MVWVDRHLDRTATHPLHTLSDSSTQTYIFYLLTGVFINIWSEIFNLGIKLKEEQELTI